MTSVLCVAYRSHWVTTAFEDAGAGLRAGLSA
jgi:hypothetical protein